MPYAVLVDTSLDPSFNPLVPAIRLNGTDQDYMVFESFFQIGAGEKTFESFFVVEGLRGLYLSRGEAASRGIIDGQVVDCFIGTYDFLPTVTPAPPSVRFLIQLEAHVHDAGLIARTEEGDDLDTQTDAPTPLVVGLCDILRFFNIMLDDDQIEADANGDLDVWDKKRIGVADWILVKKPSVSRECVSLVA